MIWAFYLLIGIMIVFWLSWRYKNRRLLKMASKLPGPRTLPFVGNSLIFVCQPDELIVSIKDSLRNYGEILRFWLGPDLNIVVSNPDDLKALLSNTKTSVKGPQYKYIADILGGGISSGSGPAWRKHRKIAAPNYGKRAIENYNEIFNKEIDILLDTYRALPKGEMLNIYKYNVKCTSHSVCQTLIGLTRQQTLEIPHFQKIIDLTPRMYDIVFDRMTKWYLQIYPIFWLTDSYKQQKQFMKMMVDFSTKIINYRREKINTLKFKNQDDIINVNEDVVDNTKLSVIDRFILSEELNDEELIHETFTIFTSSQEASAKIASFLLLTMAYHPECQKKLYAEIFNVIGEEDRWVTDKDLKKMPYLEMVFKEVLRLYPIGAMLQRTIREDITTSCGTLPAGCSLVIPIYHLHRDPRFWENPEDFDPERFNLENTKLRQPNCYLPFSYGPMDCLEPEAESFKDRQRNMPILDTTVTVLNDEGKHLKISTTKLHLCEVYQGGRWFGTKLIKTISVRVLREFELSSSERYKDLKLSIAISASPLEGFKAILHPRRRNS